MFGIKWAMSYHLVCSWFEELNQVPFEPRTYFQIHFTSRHSFIILVSIIPRPPWSLGLTMISNLAVWHTVEFILCTLIEDFWPDRVHRFILLWTLLIVKSHCIYKHMLTFRRLMFYPSMGLVSSESYCEYLKMH